MPGASAYHGTLNVADFTEVQVLSNTSGVGVGGLVPSFNIANILTADLALDWGRTKLALHYAPLFTLRSVEARFKPDVLHQGSVTLTARSRRTEISLVEYGTLGTTNYATSSAAPTGTPKPALQAVPINAVLTTAASRTSLSITRYVTRGAWFSLGGGYALSGGLDDASRKSLPLQPGPFGIAHVEGSLTRQDRLVFDIDYEHDNFSDAPCTDAPTTYGDTSFASCSPTADRADAALGVRHRVSQATDFLLQAGASGVAQKPTDGAATRVKAYPVIAAQMASSKRQLTTQTTFTLTLRLSPIIAQQTGAVDYRSQLDTGIDWSARRLSLHALVRLSEPIPATTPGTYFDGWTELGGAYRLSRGVTFSGGQRFDYQRITAGPNVFASFSYARIELTAPPTKF
jgi:hypothetical protein